MGNRIFVGVVVMLWMATMSWLMVARILPPFFNGEPPGHGVITNDEPVCWDIEHDDDVVGHAVSKAVPGAAGTTEIHSRVQLDGLEIRKLAPQWMSTIVRGIGAISLDTRSRIVIDSLNNLSSFETRVQLNDLPLVMKVTGRVDGPDLLLKINSGEVTHTARYPVPKDSLLASELIPEPKLLQVYVGASGSRRSTVLFARPEIPWRFCRQKLSKNAGSMGVASESGRKRLSIERCRRPA